MGINHGMQWGYRVSDNSHQFSTAVDISRKELWGEKDIFVYPSRFLKNLSVEITNTHIKIEYDHG
jgi:hypothetical protein